MVRAPAADRPIPKSQETGSAGGGRCTIDFTVASLSELRRLVAHEATVAGLERARREELVLAVDELATNSVAHAGGAGTLAIWREQRAIVCEVRDNGHIEDPLVGLRPPAPEQIGGRGLWIVGRVCDRVRISSAPEHTAVRVHMRLD